MSLGIENTFFYIFVGAPRGPDLRRAPGWHRGGPRGGRRAQGRAQGRATQGPGPDACAKRALDSSVYIFTCTHLYMCIYMY